MDLSPVDMNEVLHAQRTALLRRVPKGAKVFLSAGCAGAWYFEWIAEAYGPVEQHIGLEFYSPEPEGLPPEVTWIANTVGDMEAVGDDSVDLVFSGQNIEHLWPHDVVGFYREANRVLVDGGRLVIDSPNRLVTAALAWSHPEHTVELTASEAVELTELAGFRVEVVQGMWQSVVDGRLLPEAPADEAELVQRSIGALDHPDDSFCWWLEAVRTGAPDVDALTVRMDEIFESAWPERVNRLRPLAGDVSDDGATITSHEGTEGAVFFGPYVPLQAGRHRVTFTVTALDDALTSPGRCEVVAAEEVVASEEIPAMWPGQTTTVTVVADVEEMTFGGQFRLISNGTARLRSPLRVAVESVLVD